MGFTTATTSHGTTNSPRLLMAYGVIFLLSWVYTLVTTSDGANWITENVLTFLFLGVMAWGYPRFRFSDLSFTMMFAFMMLHIFGAQHTYANAPLGYWIQDMLNLERNHYDRIVHFSFGLMMAYPMRDYFLNKMQWPIWVCWVLPVEITLSFSGAYEIIEFAVAEFFFPDVGVAYLGTQGDPWDAQKDMLLAFTGAITSMVLTAVIGRKRRKALPTR